MVKQFDIITVDLEPSRGKEKKKYRPCVVVSNNLINQGSAFSWVMPITNRDKRLPSDLIVKSKNEKVSGIVDTVQIRALDLKARGSKVIDELHDDLKIDILETIVAHSEIVE